MKLALLIRCHEEQSSNNTLSHPVDFCFGIAGLVLMAWLYEKRSFILRGD